MEIYRRLIYFALRVGIAQIEGELSIEATEIRQTTEIQTEPIAWGN